MTHRSFRPFAIAIALLCAGTAGLANAQNFALNPTFGTANLSAGFSPDPYSVPVTAGGEIDASGTIVGCVGFVADAPDFRVNYNSGGFNLYFSAWSSSDTTLIINAPDGNWYCDDDSAGNRNPGLAFFSPLAGQYDIWVGSFGGGLPNATLQISEVGF